MDQTLAKWLDIWNFECKNEEKKAYSVGNKRAEIKTISEKFQNFLQQKNEQVFVRISVLASNKRSNQKSSARESK